MGNICGPNVKKTIKTEETTVKQPAVSRERLLHSLYTLDYPSQGRRPSFYMSTFNLTHKAFHYDKPLFAEEEKERALKELRRCLPVVIEGYNYLGTRYKHLCKFIAVEERRDAQISRSGLQFIFDEVTEEEDNELHEQLQTLINSSIMERVEEYIKDTINCRRDWGTDEEVDPALIPPSHYWWFYIDSDDEDEE